MKHQKAAHWPLGEECEAVRDLVLDSGLGRGILYHQHEFDSIIASAFRERYWLETDTFHLPFGEMTINPDDVKQILDLNIEGKVVSEGFDNNMSWTDLYALVKDTLGWEPPETEKQFKWAGGDKPTEPREGPVIPVKKILLKNMKDMFGGTHGAVVKRKEVIMKRELVIQPTRTYCMPLVPYSFLITRGIELMLTIYNG
ncbi:uncharacterized protein LOC113273570 [Papaver somniferum]|uniref:uncharacterized protein LOC113273570 n=1 Tax=Papaver somniferum TaxID=3469 RepID=UPI000E6FE9C3|nr:uncharacterized protein LOC113273570 [Papaver somniferum]